MQRRIKLSDEIQRIFEGHFANLESAREILARANRDLSVASAVVLTLEGIKSATVDGMEADELLVTVPDVPEELNDKDRAPVVDAPDVGKA